MNIIEPAEILEEYRRIVSQSVISHIERLLSADLIKTGISPIASGLPSLMYLRGLGKEIWKGVDAQDYVKKLRDEWKD